MGSSSSEIKEWGPTKQKDQKRSIYWSFFLKMNSRFTFTSLISPLNYSGQLLLDATGRSCVNNKIERLLGKSEIRKFLGSWPASGFSEKYSVSRICRTTNNMLRTTQLPLKITLCDRFLISIHCILITYHCVSKINNIFENHKYEFAATKGPFLPLVWLSPN